VLNNVFFKILKNLKNYDPNIPFEAWIRRIAINTQIDEFRKKSRSQIEYHEAPMQLANLTMMDYNEADKMFDAEELEIMIRTLPPTSQKVFNLYVIDGYNHKEIGEQLNISEGTSKWHLSSARAKLKELMRKILNNVAAV
jgi:RNA polymerase sigma-70 factor (ECF subfamily)